MKKNWRLLACLFALPALPLLAAQPGNQDVALDSQETAAQFVSKKTCSVGAKSQKQMPAQPEEETIRSQPIITPPVAPHVMDGTDTYVSVDFIWWKSVVGGMQYALTGVTDNGYFVKPFGTSTETGRVGNPGFKFQPGVKAGIGVNFEHDGWDLYAEYTYLSSPSQTTSISGSDGIGAVLAQPTYFNNGLPGVVQIINASCQWNQDFNVIDVELGRDYFVSRYLTMRPNVGFKTGWINQSSIVSAVPTGAVVAYDTPTGAPGIAPYGSNKPTSIVQQFRQNMWGLGIRTGLNTNWHVTKNWGFYNDFAFTALWADFKINGKQNLTETVVGNTTTASARETFQTVIPVLEAGLGISYITWFEQSRYRFEFRGGWEEQIWLDFNHFTNLTGTGNLTLQGLTVKAMLNF